MQIACGAASSLGERVQLLQGLELCRWRRWAREADTELHREHGTRAQLYRVVRERAVARERQPAPIVACHNDGRRVGLSRMCTGLPAPESE